MSSNGSLRMSQDELTAQSSRANGLYKVKPDEHGRPTRFKARLVALGCRQRPGIDFDETWAPTASAESIRVLLSIAAIHDLELRQFDVTSAFLGAPLKETVFMRPPPGMHKGNMIIQLNKTIYGLDKKQL